MRVSRRPLFRAVPPLQKARIGLADQATTLGSLMICVGEMERPEEARAEQVV
jgi:hypothetical protein